MVAHLAKERNGPSIRYQVLMYPVTDSSMSQASYEEFANGPWLARAAMAWFWDAYAPNKEDRKKTAASPLSATLEQLKGLPPGLVIVDENDILRDEGEEYARKFIQAGVEVTPLRVLATHHDYALLNALANTPATKVTVLEWRQQSGTDKSDIVTVVQLKLGAAPSTQPEHIAGLAPLPRGPRASTDRVGGDARPRRRR